MAVYVFIQNAWSAQQTLFEESGFESAIIQAKANEDASTGLVNRRGLDIAVTGWITRRQPFAIMLIAVDPPSGVARDQDVQPKNSDVSRVSQLLSSRVSAPDLIGRWSSNEFLLICRDTDPRALTLFANDIRGFVERQTGRNETPVTISIGISLFPLFELFEATVDRAEQALRMARNAGMNCARSYWTD